MDRSKSEAYMRLAIRKAKSGVRRGQTPFGACIVRHDRVLACTHNQVWSRKDITAHAEILALRRACRVLGRVDLSGAVLYSTCEPCPMCFTASHWARVEAVVFGASIADAHTYGFNELRVSCEHLRRIGSAGFKLHGGCLREECLRVFNDWARMPEHRAY